MNRIPAFGWAGLLAALLCAPAAQAHEARAGQWQKLENLPAVVGADGQSHTATCSGFPGTDPAFSFWAKKGKSKNLVVYFEGGGACWDNLTCTFPIAPGMPSQVPQFFVPAIAPGSTPATYDGIFKADNPANPVGDWSFVYIPYCTGDLHAGSSVQQYFNVGHPVLPLPSSFTLQHKGFDNFMVVLDWMKKHMKEPERVLVAGSSAGGYGASVNFPWVAKTYPEARMHVIADASQGVTTAAWDAHTPGRGSWNMQLAPWVFGSNPSAIAGPDLLAKGAQAYPRAKLSQFTTAMDGVQIGFYSVMKGYYGPGGACPNPAIDWYQQMSTKLQSYDASLPNFRHYLAGGTYHTTLRSPTFYTEASGGTVYADWVANMLAPGKRAQRQWVSEDCPTCMLQLPCP